MTTRLRPEISILLVLTLRTPGRWAIGVGVYSQHTHVDAVLANRQGEGFSRWDFRSVALKSLLLELKANPYH